jgi:hypothetical protein
MAAYLLERIAEDERVAREAVPEHPGPWYPGDHSDAAVVHVARWDPDRVLIECEAKRRIVERCQSVLTQGAMDLAEEVLQRLVQVYAERPDFPLEWFLEWLPEVPQ